MPINQKQDSSAENKKRMILEISRDLFAKYGFSKTTLDDIANALGMKKPSLYYYYNNKEAILFDVIQNEKKTYLNELTAAIKSKLKICDKVLEYERAKIKYLRAAVNPYDMTVSLYLEIKNKIQTVLEEIIKDEETIVKQIIDEGIKNNEIKKCDSKGLAKSIVTISEAIRYRELYNTSTPKVNQIDFKKAENDIEFIIKLVFEGLKK